MYKIHTTLSRRIKMSSPEREGGGRSSYRRQLSSQGTSVIVLHTPCANRHSHTHTHDFTASFCQADKILIYYSNNALFSFIFFITTLQKKQWCCRLQNTKNQRQPFVVRPKGLIPFNRPLCVLYGHYT